MSDDILVKKNLLILSILVFKQAKYGRDGNYGHLLLETRHH